MKYEIKQNKTTVQVDRSIMHHILRVHSSSVAGQYNKTLRIAKRAARLAERNLGPSASTDGKSYFFPFWLALSSILPARLVAKNLVQQHEGCTFQVVVSTDMDHEFSRWLVNDALLEVYLAHELLRKGQKVECFSIKNNKLTKIKIEPNFLDENIEIFFKNDTAICTRGIKNHLFVMNKIFNKFWTLGGNSKLKYDGYSKPSAFFYLDNSPFSKSGIECAEQSSLTIYQFLVRSLYDYKAYAQKLTEEFVVTNKLKHLHICQHPFLETALLEDAVIRNGGIVTLWPHSINNSRVMVGFKARAQSIVQIVKQPKHDLNMALPHVNFKTHSDICLVNPPPAPRVNPEAPLNIIIIASPHITGDVYVLDYDKHVETYAKLFDGLKSRSGSIQYLIKGRNPSEDRAWFCGNFESGLQFIERLPMASGMENMLFVNVGYASSTIYEGIAHGIPSIVVREQDLDDYIPFDVNSIPVLSVNEALEYFDKLINIDSLHELYENQLNWYYGVVNFELYSHPQLLSDKLKIFSRSAIYLIKVKLHHILGRLKLTKRFLNVFYNL